MSKIPEFLEQFSYCSKIPEFFDIKLNNFQRVRNFWHAGNCVFTGTPRLVISALFIEQISQDGDIPKNIPTGPKILYVWWFGPGQELYVWWFGPKIPESSDINFLSRGNFADITKNVQISIFSESWENIDILTFLVMSKIWIFFQNSTCLNFVWSHEIVD